MSTPPTLATVDRREFRTRDRDDRADRPDHVDHADHADAGAWPESIDVSFYADTSMTLPGEGSPGKQCGEWYPAEFCDECGEVHFGESRCEQRSCPSCWSAWSRRRAEKITRRLGAARHDAESGAEKRAVHAVVSPPPGEIRTLSDVSRGFRDAYELAKEKGVRGGVAIFHGYRVKDDVLDTFRELLDADLVEDGVWKWIREHCQNWRDLTYWSPHWHILGLSADFEADDPDAQGGWVARRIRSLKPFTLHDESGYSDMVGASRYLLSHATFESDTSKDCIRWFGELATTKFRPESELSEGSLAVIERKAREAAESGGERSEESADSEPCERCGSRSRSPIWNAGSALCDPGWCDRIGREQVRRLSAAFEWVIGERYPPPGMKNPQTEDEARRALESVV